MSLGNPQYLQAPLREVSGPQVVEPQLAMRTSTGIFGLALCGVIAVFAGVWGALAPFVGPTFGYAADGSRSWNMTSSHLWLAVIPGALAFVCGLLILVSVPRALAGWGKGSLSLAGVLAVVAGAWFVMGPVSWPVITTASHYFVPANPLRELAYQVGYALGTGALIILAGAFALGWTARHPALRYAGRAMRHSSAHLARPTTGPVVAEPVVSSPQVTPVATEQPVLPD